MDIPFHFDGTLELNALGQTLLWCIALVVCAYIVRPRWWQR